MSTVDDLIIRIQTIGGKTAAAEAEGVKGSFGGMAKAAVMLAGALGVGKAIDAFAAFQKQQTMLVTQTGATRKEMDYTSKAILNMAASVGTGPQALSQALFHIESLNIRGAKAMNVLRIAAEGAIVGNANLTDVTNALTQAVLSGIKGAKDYAGAMGILNAIVGAGNMTMQDLADATGKGMLDTMARFGLSLKDVGAALDVFGITGLRGAAAGTRLRTTIFAMAAPSKAAQGALDSIGLSQYSLADDLRRPNGLMVALLDLKKHLDDSGLHGSKAAALLSAAFGHGRQAAGILTLMGHLGMLKTSYDKLGAGQTGSTRRGPTARRR